MFVIKSVWSVGGSNVGGEIGGRYTGEAQGRLMNRYHAPRKDSWPNALHVFNISNGTAAVRHFINQ